MMHSFMRAPGLRGVAAALWSSRVAVGPKGRPPWEIVRRPISREASHRRVWLVMAA